MILMENTEQHKIEYLLPEEIEKRSFEIISEELVQRGIQIPAEEGILIMSKHSVSRMER